MNGERVRRGGGAAAGAAVCLAALAVLAGCASSAAVNPGGTGSSPSPSPPTSPSTSTSPGSSTSTGCAAGSIEVHFRMGEPPTGELCVHVGTKVGITLQGAHGYVWTPVASSSTDVMSTSPRTTDGGVAAGSATGHALSAGTITLSSTASFSGDPHGPPSVLWTMTIHVVP